jgi:hypothetical protein
LTEYDLVTQSSNIFGTVTINDVPFQNDILTTPISLSKLPTKIFIAFKNVGKHLHLKWVYNKALIFTWQAVILQNVTIANAKESKITSITAYTGYEDSPIPNPNPSNPTITYVPYDENIENLDISILATSDGSIPSSVQLSIFGCANPVLLSTKGQILQRITTLPTSCKTSFLLNQI